jgi:hypothetical protein
VVITERGKVRRGGIVFTTPLELPEGTDVVVRIEPVAGQQPSEAPSGRGDFARLPFFGMWADRPDMDDSEAWVRSEREQWRQRTFREG